MIVTLITCVFCRHTLRPRITTEIEIPYARVIKSRVKSPKEHRKDCQMVLFYSDHKLFLLKFFTATGPAQGQEEPLEDGRMVTGKLLNGTDANLRSILGRLPSADQRPCFSRNTLSVDLSSVQIVSSST